MLRDEYKWVHSEAMLFNEDTHIPAVSFKYYFRELYNCHAICTDIPVVQSISKQQHVRWKSIFIRHLSIEDTTIVLTS